MTGVFSPHLDILPRAQCELWSVLDGLPATARSLFGKSFQPSESLKALTSFEGGDLSTLDSSTRAALVDAVRAVRELPSVAIRSKCLSGAPPRCPVPPAL